jgi:pilus assembly protein Flp/PilA
MSATGDGIMKKIYEFLKDESGQTSTEYILLVAVVAVIIFKFKDTLSAKLDNLLTNVFKKADGLVDGM